MKSIKLKLLLPYLIGFAIAALIILYYFFILTGALSAENAVTDYLESYMRNDVNGILKYSSDYNKVSLFGSKKVTDKALKSMLKNAYAENKSIYSESDIKFSVDAVTDVEKGSNEYSDIVSKYEYIVGKVNFSKVKKVTVTVFVDGVRKQKSTVYAFKKGISWYYGYGV